MSLRNAAVEIYKEKMGRIGISMSSKLEDLQGKADRIGDMAGLKGESRGATAVRGERLRMHDVLWVLMEGVRWQVGAGNCGGWP